MPESLTTVLGAHTATPIAGGDICRAYRVQTAHAVYFAKTPRTPDPDMFSAEAWGLLALREAVSGLTPEVVHADGQWLILEWVGQRPPIRSAARHLGRRLAQLHAVAAGPFGYGHAAGRIGSLPLPCGEYATWAQMYAQLRLEPLLDAGLPKCTVLAQALRTQPEWAGPPEPPSLLHGDLWSGNVLWAGDPVLIDPACHVGHRETDLAMLALFGAPHLEQILAGYQEVYPLADGWRERVALHQLWPLLVHHRLFGGGYGQRAEHIAAGYLR